MKIMNKDILNTIINDLELESLYKLIKLPMFNYIFSTNIYKHKIYTFTLNKIIDYIDTYESIHKFYILNKNIHSLCKEKNIIKNFRPKYFGCCPQHYLIIPKPKTYNFIEISDF